MALEPRTHLLAAGQVTASGLTTIAVAEPGTRILVKYVNIIQFTGNTTDLGLWVQDGAVLSPIIHLGGIPSAGSITLVECYAVVNEDAELQLNVGANAGGGVYFHVGGLIFQL